MKIITNLDQLEKITKPVVTIGTFDGVHLGHREILERLSEIAEDIDGSSVLITFNPHPRKVLYPEERDLALLTSYNEKIKILETTGLDYLIIIPFTLEFSKTSSEKFIHEILCEKIKCHTLVIGYNHHFGFNRNGNAESLTQMSKEYCFDVEIISEILIKNIAVSSTKIRKALSEGNFKEVSSFLGYDYMMSGKVIEGNKIGRTIGFATANIQVDDEEKLIPAKGVYAVEVALKSGLFKGMLNIGTRPTLKLTKLSIEVNIFDFDEDIYGQNITIYFRRKMREEKLFDNLEELKNQLLADKEACLILWK